MTDRLRRSFLYTPADEPEMMEKAIETVADAVIFDLEDAVPNDALPDARANLAAVLERGLENGTETCVRINGLQTPHWEDDVAAAVGAGVDTIVLPVIETVEQTEQAIAAAKAADGTLPEFVVTIETPRGLFAAESLAEQGRQHGAITGFSYGIGDYARAVGATGTPAQLHRYVRNVAVSAASIGNLDPIDTVYQEYSDTEGLREHAAAARECGYLGQKAIHPKQLPVINDVYTPTSAEVEEARRFVEAFDSADRASIVVDGVFLDTAIVDQYRTLLRRSPEVAE